MSCYETGEESRAQIVYLTLFKMSKNIKEDVTVAMIV